MSEFKEKFIEPKEQGERINELFDLLSQYENLKKEGESSKLEELKNKIIKERKIIEGFLTPGDDELRKRLDEKIKELIE